MPKNLAAKKVKVSPLYTREEKEAIADDIVEYIRERSRAGKGPGNRKWAGSKGKYSDAYVNSLDFKIAGKSKGKVNQTLSGEMLVEMDVLNVKSDEIAYGFAFGSEEHGKAKGNIIGSYGKPKGDPKKARDFLRLTNRELNAILERYPLRGEDAEERRAESVQARLKAIEIFRRITDAEE